jgi:hypothetical protein
MTRRAWLEIILIIGTIVCLGVLFASGFDQMPLEQAGIATDWTTRIYKGLEGGVLEYVPIRGPHHPPWSMLPVIPLGLLGASASWGVLVYTYLLVLTFSVPYKRPIWRSVLALALLLSAHVTLRTALDGNLEILSLAGVLLLVIGYNNVNGWILAIGVLLGSAKPQVGALLIIVVAFYVLRVWPRSEWLKAAALVLPIVALTALWRGREWFEIGFSTGHLGWIGSGVLGQTLSPIGAAAVIVLVIVALLYVLFKTGTTLSREKAAFIIATTLIIAPYGSIVSLLSLIAVGIIPLFLRRFWLGLLLILLMNVPTLTRLLGFLTDLGVQPDVPQAFWNIPLLCAWGSLGWHVVSASRQSDEQETMKGFSLFNVFHSSRRTP